MSEPTEKPKNKGGRPPSLKPDDETLKTLRKLGSLHATHEEAAAFLEVSRKTFSEFLRNNKKAEEAFEAGKGQGRLNLRRQQMKAAENGNSTMLVWLGKQLLDQKDKHQHGGDPENPIEHRHNVQFTIVDPATDTG